MALLMSSFLGMNILRGPQIFSGYLLNQLLAGLPAFTRAVSKSYYGLNGISGGTGWWPCNRRFASPTSRRYQSLGIPS